MPSLSGRNPNRGAGAPWFSSALFWPALAVYSFTLPIAHSIAVRNGAFLLLILATLGMCVDARRRPLLPLWGAWALYAGVALLSAIGAVAPRESLGEVRVEVLYPLIVFSIAATWGCRRSVWRAFAAIVAAANLVLVIAAFVTIGLGSSMATVMALPPLAKAGVNSNYLLTLIPLLLLWSWDFWRCGRRLPAFSVLALVLLNVLALILSYNRQGVVALAGGAFCGGALLLAGQFTRRRLVVFVAIMAVLGALVVAQMARRTGTFDNVEQLATTAVSQDVRWQLWRFSVARIAEHPLYGGGFGRITFEKLYPEYMRLDRNIWHAHNMILNKGIQMGVPGMVAFLLLWLGLLRSFVPYLDGTPERRAIAIAGLSTLAAVFLKNMTDDFFVRDMLLWFWLIVGILLGSLKRPDDGRPPA